MTTPCTQADKISNINSTLERMERSQQEQTELIRSVADQNARISSIEKTLTHYEGHFTESFNRIRDAEAIIGQHGNGIQLMINETIAPVCRRIDRATQFLGLLTHKWTLVALGIVLGLVLTGSICDLIYHQPILQKIWNAVKG